MLFFYSRQVPLLFNLGVVCKVLGLVELDEIIKTTFLDIIEV